MLIHGRGAHRSELDSWNSLKLFLLYRLGLSSVILLLHTLDLTSAERLQDAPLFLITAQSLFTANVLLIAPTFLRIINFRWLVMSMVLLDIVAFSVLMYSSTGLPSGLGLLMIPSVAGASLLMPGTLAPVFAALGTTAIFAETGYGVATREYGNTELIQAAIQGVIFFAVALLAAKLAKKAQASEALATQRGKDLVNLSELNTLIVEHMDAGVIVTGDDGRVRLINQAAAQILGKPQVKHIIHLDRLSPALFADLSHWLIEQRDDEKLYRAENPGGSDFSARLTRIGKGRQISTFIYLQDMSEHNRQLQEIKLAALGRLTASIAHEIRNPLGSIGHAAQLLQESADLNRADQRLVEIVHSNTLRMNTLVENVLDLSRRKSPQRQRLNIQTWLKTTLNELRGQIGLEGKELELEPSLAEECMLVDPNHLRQVLWNLLINAKTYATSNQPLHIKVKGHAHFETLQVWIEVIDNGPGISSDIEDKLFEPFFTTGANGNGLGLYLSKELCESNGGSLDRCQHDEGGSCFRIQLPLEDATASSIHLSTMSEASQ